VSHDQITTRHQPHSSPFTRRQLRQLETLPDDYRVLCARDGTPIVESPTGQTLLLERNGRLAATKLVESVQSYLHVPRG
jgi:hypothetical protein